MPPVSLVLFDAGGTLITARPSVGEIYASLAARYGAVLDPGCVAGLLSSFLVARPELKFGTPPTYATSEAQELEFWRTFTGLLYRRLVSVRASEEEWFRAAWETFARGEAWAVYEDVWPALRALAAAGLRLAIVSNWDARLVTICDQVGLGGLMSCVQYSSGAGIRKPNPRIFEQVLERLDVPAAQAVHVGDSWADDVEGARAAGIRPILVDRDGTFAHVDPGAVERVRSLAQVAGLLLEKP